MKGRNIYRIWYASGFGIEIFASTGSTRTLKCSILREFPRSEGPDKLMESNAVCMWHSNYAARFWLILVNTIFVRVLRIRHFRDGLETRRCLCNTDKWRTAQTPSSNIHFAEFTEEHYQAAYLVLLIALGNVPPTPCYSYERMSLNAQEASLRDILHAPRTALTKAEGIAPYFILVCIPNLPGYSHSRPTITLLEQ